MNADLFMSRAVYHITADHYHLLFEVPQMNADLFMSRSCRALLCLAIAEHLLSEEPQMNADPAMSREVDHVASDHYSVLLLQTTSSYSSW
jgi:hypothetical protein